MMKTILLFIGLALIAQRGDGSVQTKTQTVQYQSGTDTVSAFLCEPILNRPTGSVIFIHDRYGLTDAAKQLADSLARAAGVRVLAIDLYRGAATSDFMVAHELERGVPEDRVSRDIEAAYIYLHENAAASGGKFGVIGWAMGGRYALQAAIGIPLSACVTTYGTLITNPETLKKISASVLGNFASNDLGIDASTVKTFTKQLRAANVQADIKIFPNTKHGFMDAANSSYNAVAAKAAWQRIVVFLKKTLG
jgi:carboxymethylenebutenolidase